MSCMFMFLNVFLYHILGTNISLHIISSLSRLNFCFNCFDIFLPYLSYHPHRNLYEYKCGLYFRLNVQLIWNRCSKIMSLFCYTKIQFVKCFPHVWNQTDKYGNEALIHTMKHFVVKIKGCVTTQLICIWNEELHKCFKSIVNKIYLAKSLSL